MRGDATCSVCGRDIFRGWIDGELQPWKHWVEPHDHRAAPVPETSDPIDLAAALRDWLRSP